MLYKDFKFKRLLCIICLLIAIFCGFRINEIVPHLHETITLTALGQKNDLAKAEEVHYLYCTIDEDRDHDGSDDIYYISDFSSGKWFWCGNQSVMWRIETDPRQPEGLTRSISFDVPVGKTRELQFVGNTWNGYVEVTTDNTSQIIDTYNEYNEPIRYELPSSSNNLIVKDMFLHLGIMLSIAFILFFLLMHIVRQLYNPGHFWMNHWQILLYLTISVAALLFYNSFADSDSFWLDEMATIGVTSKSYLYAITSDVHLPPLYYSIIWFWLRIAPFGEEYLLLPNEVFAAAGVFTVAMIGRKYMGFAQGLIAELACVASKFVVFQCANELRNYSLLFFISACMIYCLLGIIENPMNRTFKSSLLYSLALVTASYTHYFCIFLMVPIFLIETTLFIRNKTKITYAIPYVVAGILYLPWVYYVFKCASDTNNLWCRVPNSNSLVELTKNLCGSIDCVFYIFIFGVVLTIAGIIRDKQVSLKGHPERTTLIIAISLVSVIYFYGRYIALKSTFWVDRYFVCLIPCVAIVTSYALWEIALNVKKNFSNRAMWIMLITVILSVFFPSLIPYMTTIYHKDSYRDSANYLLNHYNDIYNEDTLILIKTTTVLPEHYSEGHEPSWVTDGFNEYYLTHCGVYDQLNVEYFYELSENELLQYDHVYLYYEHIYSMNDGLMRVLDDQYTIEEDDPNVKVRKYVREN